MKHLSTKEVDAIIAANNVPRDRYPVVVVAVRGRDLDAGVDGVNDRRRYDDSHNIRTPKECLQFVGNTDPNGYRAGHGTGEAKGMGMLAPGIHLFAKGLHKGKIKGFRQAEVFTFLRDKEGGGSYRDTGWHGCNWHPGGGNDDSVCVTWSLACQTNPAERFAVLQPALYRLLDQFGNEMGFNDLGQASPLVPYILIDETERLKGNLVVSKRYF